MNITQEPIQVTEPLSNLLNARTTDIADEISSAISAYNAPSQTSDRNSENELRSPLREISENTIDLSEIPEQEQELKNQEGLDDGLGNINEYVARIMEKLEKQKQKTVKLGDLLDNKEKSQQVNALADVFESLTAVNDENVDIDVSAKENLSPVKGRPSKVEKVASPIKEIPKLKLDEILHISKQNISYGTKFPGQIAEEHFEIVNKSNQDFVVKIEVDCLNEDLQDTEEYVFSVRRSHLHEYNDRHYLIMAPYSCAAFKFALKVPNMKIKEDIEGQVRVSIEDVPGSYILNLKAKVAIPKVFCPKELRLKGMDYGITNLAVKESKKQDFKIPIKNNGNVPVTLEFDFYEPKNEQENDTRQLFDILAHPSVLTIPANGTAQVNIIVKPWKIPRSMRGEKIQPVRKILVGKVRDSALVYSFVFGVQIY